VREPIFEYRITDYNRSNLPNRFLAFMDEGVESPADWIQRTGRSLGHPGWGLLYHLTLTLLQPRELNLIVETGTNVGSTAIIVAQAIKDSGREGVVRTIEIDEEIATEAARRFRLAGVEQWVEPIVGDSLKALTDVVRDGETIRLAFLDGNHFHDHVVREFELVHDHLLDDSVVVFDNTFNISEGREDPRVNGALKTIVGRYGGNLINLPVCSWYTPGVAIWQRSAFSDMVPPDPGSFDPNT
jgi:hypothetical protein